MTRLNRLKQTPRISLSGRGTRAGVLAILVVFGMAIVGGLTGPAPGITEANWPGWLGLVAVVLALIRAVRVGAVLTAAGIEVRSWLGHRFYAADEIARAEFIPYSGLWNTSSQSDLFAMLTLDLRTGDRVNVGSLTSGRAGAVRERAALINDELHLRTPIDPGRSQRHEM